VAETGDPNTRLLYGAYTGSMRLVRQAAAEGADVEVMEAGTEMTALHLAVGRGWLDIARYLIEESGAAIKPDGHGRWPTVIAAQCGAPIEMCDYIAEREAAVATGRS
jgi:hypothetical protein